ncbi:hypothetical protein Tco_1573554 [Tanacetum coccineum]
MDASDLARAKVMSLRTTVLAQQSEIRELQSADRRRQTVITEMLAADHKRQVQLTKALKLVKRLQTQMAELQRQQGPAKGPAQPELPEEAACDANKSKNGDDSHNSGIGMEGFAGLSQRFKRMESIFPISNCTIENQVKFATCTLHSVALTWWNTHVKTVGYDAAYDQETGNGNLGSESEEY